MKLQVCKYLCPQVSLGWRPHAGLLTLPLKSSSVVVKDQQHSTVFACA